MCECMYTRHVYNRVKGKENKLDKLKFLKQTLNKSRKSCYL